MNSIRLPRRTPRLTMIAFGLAATAALALTAVTPAEAAPGVGAIEMTGDEIIIKLAADNPARVWITPGLPNDAQVLVSFQNQGTGPEVIPAAGCTLHTGWTSPQTTVFGCGSGALNIDVSFLGSEGDDVVHYVNNPITGLQPSLLLHGRGGDDELWGGPGWDLLDGGTGDDSLAGGYGFGHDEFIGGSGTDTVTFAGEPTSVHVDLDGVADDGPLSWGGRGDNVRRDVETVIGGDGDDIINLSTPYALSFTSTVRQAFGGVGNDQLAGGSGSDVLIGGDGFDIAAAGSGNDTCSAERRSGCEVVLP